MDLKHDIYSSKTATVMKNMQRAMHTKESLNPYYSFLRLFSSAGPHPPAIFLRIHFLDLRPFIRFGNFISFIVNLLSPRTGTGRPFPRGSCDDMCSKLTPSPPMLDETSIVFIISPLCVLWDEIFVHTEALCTLGVPLLLLSS